MTNQEDRIFLAYEQRKQLRKLLLLPLFVGIGVAGYAVRETGTWLLAVGVAIVGLASFALWRTWRCPACEGPLGQEWNAAHCVHCGTRLQP